MGLRGARVLAAATLLLGGAGCSDVWGCTSTTEVRGVVGSEKVPFFEDEDVKSQFDDHCLSIEVQPAGSRQIARSVDWDEYDFVFPSSEPVAASIQQARNIHEVYRPFHTPMVIASFESVAQALAAEGVAEEEGDGVWTFDMEGFIELVAKDRRWGELDEDLPLGRQSVLIRTTDPRDSNSGAMYLALVSYIANGNEVVQNAQQEQAVRSTVTDLFLKQGFAAPTSAPPFEAYLSQGIGHSPLLFIYEAQFLEQAMRDDSLLVLDSDDPNRKMALLYPSPTVQSTHTLVPLNSDGSDVGQWLVEDDDLQELAATHGLRTRDPQQFLEIKEERIDDLISVPDQVVDVVSPPAFEVLERLIDAVDRAYRNEGAPPLPDDEGAG